MSNREAYVPPSVQTPLSSQAQALGSSQNYSNTSGSVFVTDQLGPLTQYLCGDCNSKVHLKKGDPIRCKECGHRVLYKERTRRYVVMLF